MRDWIEDVLGGHDAFPCWCAGVGGMALVMVVAVVLLGGYSALAPDSAMSEAGYRDRLEVFEAAGRVAAIPGVLWAVANAGEVAPRRSVGVELVRGFGGLKLPGRQPAVALGESKRRRARPAAGSDPYGPEIDTSGVSLDEDRGPVGEVEPNRRLAGGVLSDWLNWSDRRSVGATVIMESCGVGRLCQVALWEDGGLHLLNVSPDGMRAAAMEALEMWRMLYGDDEDEQQGGEGLGGDDLPAGVPLHAESAGPGGAAGDRAAFEGAADPADVRGGGTG